MKLRRWIAIPLLFVLLCPLWAQTDPQIGQYMYLQTTYNPASIGENDLLRVSGMHRMQYVGISDAPMTTYFNFSSPFAIGKTKHAAGVRFLNDMYGLFSNQALHAQYAYRHAIGGGVLSVGVDLGFVNLSFKSDKINLDTIAQMGGLEDSHFFEGADSDPLLPKGSGEKGSTGMSFDMGLGIYYSAPTWWASASYSHVTRPKVHWASTGTNGEVVSRMVGTLYLAGGYNWRLNRSKDWVLKPSAMVMTDFASWDVNLTMLAEVKERFRFGAGYRLAGSVNVLLGVDIVSGLQVGYTYELPANKLIVATSGSHEIFLAYGFNILKPKRTNKYKSVRYL